MKTTIVLLLMLLLTSPYPQAEADCHIWRAAAGNSPATFHYFAQHDEGISQFSFTLREGEVNSGLWNLTGTAEVSIGIEYVNEGNLVAIDSIYTITCPSNSYNLFLPAIQK